MYRLMSNAYSKFRTAFVGFVVALQIFLLPATHVLHLGCQHPTGHVHLSGASSTSVFDSLVDAWAWCWNSHCCDHDCGRGEKPVLVAGEPRNPDSPQEQHPAEPAHDENSCPVCQAVFAARIAATVPVAVFVTQPLCECLAEQPPFFCETPRFGVLSRGPPPVVVA